MKAETHALFNRTNSDTPKLDCPVCADTTKKAMEDRSLSIYRCKVCSHVFSVISKSEQEPYDETYFSQEHKGWFDNPNTGLFQFITQKLKTQFQTRPFALLDIGCGKGDFLRHAKKALPKAHIFGIDLIRNEWPGIVFIQGDFFVYPFGERFDTVVSLATIEHVDNPAAFVKRIYELLQPEGTALLMTINSNGMIYRCARLLRHLGIRSPFERLYGRHHLQHFTNESLIKLLRLHRMDVLLQKNHNFPIKAIDLPKCNALLQFIFKCATAVLFAVSNPLQLGMMQTVICRRSR